MDERNLPLRRLVQIDLHGYPEDHRHGKNCGVQHHREAHAPQERQKMRASVLQRITQQGRGKNHEKGNTPDPRDAAQPGERQEQVLGKSDDPVGVAQESLDLCVLVGHPDQSLEDETVAGKKGIRRLEQGENSEEVGGVYGRYDDQSEWMKSPQPVVVQGVAQKPEKRPVQHRAHPPTAVHHDEHRSEGDEG